MKNSGVLLVFILFFAHVAISQEPRPAQKLRDDHLIDSIVVTGGRARMVKLGHSSAGVRVIAFSAPFFTTTEIKQGVRGTRELGTTINIRRDAEIRSLEMFINTNGYDCAKFRLAFYAMDGEHVGERIVDKDIAFEVRDRTSRRFKLDLTPYDIRLDGGQEVLVALTLLDEEADGSNHKYFAINAAVVSGKGIYTRDGGNPEWTRHGGTLTMFLNAKIYGIGN